jgi:hypothetical protein
MLHQAEFGLGRAQRVADVRAEVERDRLEGRLRSARREEEARATTLFTTTRAPSTEARATTLS